MAMSIGVGYESSDDSDRRDGKRKAKAIKKMSQHMPGMEHTVYRRSTMDGDKASTRSYSADGVLPRQRRCTVQDMNGSHKLQVVTPKQLEDISQRSAPGCMLLESVSGNQARKSRARQKNTPKELVAQLIAYYRQGLAVLMLYRGKDGVLFKILALMTRRVTSHR